MHTLLPLLLATISYTALTIATCSIVSDVKHTFYGWPDNDPAGASTAYSCDSSRPYIAGGTGTFADPLTFASAPGEFDECEIIYDPYTRKYLRFEDYCAQCNEDWADGTGSWHVDIWTGGSTEGDGDVQVQCEDALTPDDQGLGIVRSPGEDLEVDGGFFLFVLLS